MFRKTLILTLLVALLAACAPAPSTPVVDSAPTDAAATEAVATEAATESAAYLVTSDGLGREVTLAAPAERVVSLAPSTTEILFAVGAGAQVVGRDEFSDYPAEAAAIESVGGSMGEYSVESIVALEPDLVLAAEINTPELVSQLEELGLTVFYVNNPTTIEEMYGSLENVAALTG
ncbi:MAG TPA: helical backbone metal receptor, partial [Anaerolineales bacterium]|nr:helical backbone metal receptor [Anaerolineales bacterium]